MLIDRDHPTQVYALQLLLIEHENILGPAGVLLALQDAIVRALRRIILLRFVLTLTGLCSRTEPHSYAGESTPCSCPVALSPKTMGHVTHECRRAWSGVPMVRV